MAMMQWLAEELDFEKVVPFMANSLSILTIISCLFMKVPQIIFIKQKRSAEGIYVQALGMEILGYTIITLYNLLNNYGALTYMEYPIILIQVIMMMYYVLLYKGMQEMPIVHVMMAFYVAGISGFLVEIFPKEILSYFVPLCTPLSGFAKMSYIYGMIKTGNAGNMSLTTWMISMLTNLSRVFTVYVDSADPTLMFNFIVSTVLSAGVLGTTLYYQVMACPAHRVVRRKYGQRRGRDD